MNTMALAQGPRYLSTIPDGIGIGNRYIVLGDDWGQAMAMPGIDQVIVECSLAVGYEAQMRFWKDGAPGPAIPLFVGSQSFSEQARYGYDRVEFRNAIEGQNAEIIAIVQGA